MAFSLIQFKRRNSQNTLFCLLFMVQIGAAAAQSPSICGQPGAKLPCVNQPVAGDTQVSGQIKQVTGHKVKISLLVSTLQGTAEQVADLEIASQDLGTFSVPVPALSTNNNVEITQTDDANSFTATVMVPVVAASNPGSTIFALGLVGINVTGSSSSGPSQQYFAAFNVLTPLAWWPKPQTKDLYPLQHHLWAWLDPRIASLPAANTSSLSSVGSSSGLSAGPSGQTIGAISQTFEFQGGLEYSFKDGWSGAQFGGGGNWARTSLSIIMGGGMVTPFNTSAPSAEYSLNNNLGQEFNQSPSLATAYPQLAVALCSYGFTGGSTSGVTCPSPAASTSLKSTPSSVAFVLPNRSRFYRDYFVGIRLRTFYLKGACPDPDTLLSPDTSELSDPKQSSTTPKDGSKRPLSRGELKASQAGCKLQNTYPGTFDLRLGQDESVTQHLSGWVATLTGTYPLPGTGGTVRIFGSAYLGLRRNKISNSLVLVPATTVSTLDQPSVVVQPIPPTDQDYYRLGLGVDLVPVIAKWVNSTSK